MSQCSSPSSMPLAVRPGDLDSERREAVVYDGVSKNAEFHYEGATHSLGGVAPALPPSSEVRRSETPRAPFVTEAHPGVDLMKAKRVPASESVSSETLRERCIKGSWKPDPGSMMLEQALDSTISHEEFRRLRSYLFEVRRKQPLRMLLIGSAVSGEGKTFVSANLAQTLARKPNESVLVIDADMRLSRLHRPLGALAGPGLAEYLEDDADIFSVIQQGPTDNLFFVAGGSPKSNPADLLTNGRLETFLQRLAPAFDWIILDSPPALLVTDASVLASLCDGVLLVVRAGVTPFDMARRALDIFREKHLLGTILNGSVPRTPYAGYYGQCRPLSKRSGKPR